MPKVNPRLYLYGALAVGMCLSVVYFFLRPPEERGAGDFWWALLMTRQILDGIDPYDFTPTNMLVPYPLTIIALGLPLFWLPDVLAASLYMGIVTGALTYCILKYDTPWRLLLLASFPFWFALEFAQWSIIISLSWYLSIINPLLVSIKPHIALPVFLAKPNWQGIGVAAVIGIITLFIYPTWPLVWLGMTREFEYIIPVTIFPFGPLLLLVLLDWKNPTARMFAGMSVLPFRGVYDLLLLWMIPQRPTHIILLTVLSWVPAAISFDIGRMIRPTWVVPVLFLPSVGMLLLASYQKYKMAKQQSITFIVADK
ncbi:MAG: hypothetical protein Fur005_06020 [Roseiflexaceae bacterium]